MLTDKECRNALPGEKPVRLPDGDGMYLLIQPNGSKWWRLDYRFQGKRNTLSLGTYPDVGLKEVREKRAEARKQMRDGVDPSKARQSLKQVEQVASEGLFLALATRWHAIAYESRTETTQHKTWRILEMHVFPALGHLPIDQITSRNIKTVIQAIGQRGALDIAKRALNHISRILNYAKSEDLVDSNAADAIDLALILPRRPVKHHAALIDPTEVGRLLRGIDDFIGYAPTTIVGLKLLALTFVRPGELRFAEWREFDLEEGSWSIPGPRMKMREPHLVPLSRQAVEILRDLYILTGRGNLLFPCSHTTLRPISENTLNVALRRMGYTGDQMTSHGFRAMARTLLHEQLKMQPEIIEHQLAHRVPDALGTAYNRTKFFKERRDMMQVWADYLDKLKVGAEIVKLRA